MADALANVIQIADRLATICRFYIESLQGYPTEWRIILLETTSLKTLLQEIDFLCEAGHSEILTELQQPKGPLEACSNCLEQLAELFPDEHDASGSSKRRKLGAALAWPLKKPKADKLLDELTHLKSTMTLAITADTARDVVEVKAAVQATRHSLDASELVKVLDWLEHTNPSRRHNEALALREENTATWLFRHPYWQSWYEGASPQRILWIHGIPGAGKTVLFSNLVNYLQRRERRSSSLSSTSSMCSSSSSSLSSSKHPVIYYYCYFGHNQDECAPLLHWVISQLCRKTRRVPVHVAESYDNHHEPNVGQLLDDLAECLQPFDRVTIAIDALDESNPRAQLLSVIEQISTRPDLDKVWILSTSRVYHEIEQTLKPISLAIPMCNKYVNADIQRYVKSKLASSRPYQDWSLPLRNETEEALTNGAKGMFRLAVCQFDILRRLHTAEAVREALRTLPESLDETYVRIFEAIPAEQQSLARNALLSICAYEGMPSVTDKWDQKVLTADLVFSLACSPQTSIYRAADVLKDVCGCLITLSDNPVSDAGYHETSQGDVDPQITLAHYTVRQFLFASRIQRSPVSFFAMTDRHLKTEYLTRILSALNDRHWLVKATDKFWLFAEANAAAMLSDGLWKYRLKATPVCWSDDNAYQTAIRLLSRFPSSVTVGGFYYDNLRIQSTASDTPPHVLVFVNMILHGDIHEDLYRRFAMKLDMHKALEATCRVKFESWNSVESLTILEIMCWRVVTSSHQVCCAAFRNVSWETAIYGMVSGRLYDWHKMHRLGSLHFFFEHGSEAAFKFLKLSSYSSSTPELFGRCGGSSFLPGYLKTPLQVAVEHANVHAVYLLYRLRVDPELTGDPNGVALEGVTPDHARHTPLEICQTLIKHADLRTEKRLRKIEQLLFNWDTVDHNFHKWEDYEDCCQASNVKGAER